MILTKATYKLYVALTELSFTNMNYNDSRQQFRRKVERRFIERREIDHQFISFKWLENIQLKYPLWPIQDRRTVERRSFKRRQIELRRTFHVHKTSLSKIEKLHKSLSEGEKNLLSDIIQQDKGN